VNDVSPQKPNGGTTVGADGDPPFHERNERMKKDMATTITVSTPYGGCPQCGRNDGLLRVDETDWLICGEHKLRWFAPSYFDGWKFDEQRRAREMMRDYNDIEGSFLPQGVWSRDPEVRAAELAAHRLKLEAEIAEREAEREARFRIQSARRESIVTTIVDGLKGITPEMDESETIKVVVDNHIRIIGSKDRVLRDVDDDIPF
jgi:hypothetical protein